MDREKIANQKLGRGGFRHAGAGQTGRCPDGGKIGSRLMGGGGRRILQGREGQDGKMENRWAVTNDKKTLKTGGNPKDNITTLVSLN